MSEDADLLLAELRQLIADCKREYSFPHHSELKTLHKLAEELANFSLSGNAVSRTTIGNWVNYGWRGIKLEARMLFSVWYTCDRWFQEFLERCSQVEYLRPNNMHLKRGELAGGVWWESGGGI